MHRSSTGDSCYQRQEAAVSLWEPQRIVGILVDGCYISVRKGSYKEDKYRDDNNQPIEMFECVDASQAQDGLTVIGQTSSIQVMWLSPTPP